MTIDYIGEVLVTGTTEVTAQACQLDGAPPLGSFVKIMSGDTAIFGVVGHITTSSLDANRRPVAFGKSVEDLRNVQPQIFSLLKTEFTILLLGYANCSAIKNFLPPQPPSLHSFVYEATKEEALELSDNFEFLQQLLSHSLPSGDMLLVAVFRQAALLRNRERRYLVQGGKMLIKWLKDDLQRFEGIIRRVEA